MPRVLVVTPQFPPDIRGGLGRQVGDLVANIAGSVEIGVVAPTDTSHLQGIRVFPFEAFGDMLPNAGVPPLLRMNMAIQSASAQALAAWKWNVIHAHDWAIAPAVCQIAQTSRVPVITTIHADNGGQLGGSDEDRFRRLSWERTLVESSSIVIAVSEPLAATLQTRYSSADVRAIPNGITIPGALRDPARANPQEILYVGRLVPYKGVQDLLAAMPLVLQPFPHARLRIVGDGFYRDELQHLTDQLQVTESVEFAGWLEGESLQEAYRRAGVVVAPSHEEAFGLVVAEAMAAGVPVIASDCPAFRALVDDRVTGRLFRTGNPQDLANVLIDALHQRDEGLALATAAREYIATRNSWPVISKRYLDLYQEVAS